MRTVAIFGGAGFVGRHLARRLVSEGWRVRLCGRTASPTHLAALPDGVEYQCCDIRDEQSVANALAGCEALVNLVGILMPDARQSFDEAHHLGPERVARAAAGLGIRRVVQMSSLGVGPDSASHYARSKAAGEAAVLRHCPHAVILRPSVIFAEDDDFINRFHRMARISLFLPLIGGGTTLFQPVHVDDVVAALVAALSGEARAGTVYELGGADVLSFADIIERILDARRLKRWGVSVPFALAHLIGWTTECMVALLGSHFPRFLIITRDQVRLLRSDNVVPPRARVEARDLAALGIRARPFSVTP